MLDPVILDIFLLVLYSFLCFIAGSKAGDELCLLNRTGEDMYDDSWLLSILLL